MASGVYSDFSNAADILSVMSDGSNSDEDEVRFFFQNYDFIHRNFKVQIFPLGKCPIDRS